MAGQLKDKRADEFIRFLIAAGCYQKQQRGRKKKGSSHVKVYRMVGGVERNTVIVRGKNYPGFLQRHIMRNQLGFTDNEIATLEDSS
jgi:hypothetical protein